LLFLIIKNLNYLISLIGNARNWWDNATRDEYNKKAKCMVQQYNDFELKGGYKINGDFTLKENIADNGAIKEAYRAYVKFVNKFGEEPLLPGLNYTQRQLFWISAAMVCIKLLAKINKIVKYLISL
jgi:neprilysin